MSIIEKPIIDIRNNINVNERFSVLQGKENKTYFHNEILVFNKEITNRLNTLTFERVLDQIKFDFDTYFKRKENDICFSLFHVLRKCVRKLNKKKINDAKQELINYAICMIKEADLREQGK
jgi:hypothetical protein